MKSMIVLALACTVGIAAASTTSSAETTDERMQKAPTKTMGDEGKLPPTEQLGTSVPKMTGPRTAASPATETTGPSGPKGPPKRMGDEGKLPATNNMSGSVPPMTTGNEGK